MKGLNRLINVFIFLLFALSTAVAAYIVIKGVAPWKLIAMYWVTLGFKNGFDYIKTIILEE